jgi:hypothetical protein
MSVCELCVSVVVIELLQVSFSMSAVVIAPYKGGNNKSYTLLKCSNSSATVPIIVGLGYNYIVSGTGNVFVTALKANFFSKRYVHICVRCVCGLCVGVCCACVCVCVVCVCCVLCVCVCVCCAFVCVCVINTHV